MFEEPDLAVLDGLLIVHDFVEGFDHHGLRFDRGAIPPPRQLQLAPEHAKFLVADGTLFDRRHNPLGRGEITEALQRHSQVPLRLSMRQVEPILPGLTQPVVDGLLVRIGHSLVLEKEAATVEVESDRGGEVVLVASIGGDAVVHLRDPAIEPRQ